MKFDLKNYYKDLAIIFLNILILFVILNLLCWAVLSLDFSLKKKGELVGPLKTYSLAKLQTAYDNMTPEEIKRLLIESWAPNRITWVYRPYIEWIEPERHGKYVNVSSAGFRYSRDQGVWPPDKKNLNIFLFGGSTTFGYGVSDKQTIASYLQSDLNGASSTAPVKVYNFGQGGEYSLQERLLFEDLLRRGMIPDLAIFLDGLNDFSPSADPDRTSTETKTIQDALALTTKKEILQAAGKLPVVTMTKKILEKLKIGAAPAGEFLPADPEKRINSYLLNKKMTESQAKVFGVKTLFIWQPTPGYNYDPKNNIFSSFGAGALESDLAKGYALLNREKSGLSGFFWLADLGEKEKGQLYVDGVHYAPRFNRVIAENIANYLASSSLIRAGKNK